MKIIPIGNRVLIKKIDQTKKQEGLIELVENNSSDSELEQGIVVECGKGKWLKNHKRYQMNVKKGDIVLYSKNLSSQIKINGEAYHVIYEQDIYGIREEN